MTTPEEQKKVVIVKPKDLFIRAATLRIIECLQRNRHIKVLQEIIKPTQCSHTTILPVLQILQKNGFIHAEHVNYPNPFIVSDKLMEATPDAILSVIQGDIALLSENIKPELFHTIMEEYGVPLDWGVLNFLNVTINPGKEVVYEFAFQGASFSLPATDAYDPQKFISQYLNRFGMLLQPIRKKAWVQVLNYLLQNAKVSEHYEDISESQLVIETVLDYVENCTRVSQIEHAISDGYCYQSGESLLVPNDVLRRVLARDGHGKVTPRQVSWCLKPFLTQNSDTRKVGQRSQRFWFFKADYFAAKEIVNLDNPEGGNVNG